MKSMLTQLNLMKDIVSHMTKYKDGAVKQVNGIESAMDAYLTTIRVKDKILSYFDALSLCMLYASVKVSVWWMCWIVRLNE